jgi:hypothetical protein
MLAVYIFDSILKAYHVFNLTAIVTIAELMAIAVYVFRANLVINTNDTSFKQ